MLWLTRTTPAGRHANDPMNPIIPQLLKMLAAALFRALGGGISHWNECHLQPVGRRRQHDGLRARRRQPWRPWLDLGDPLGQRPWARHAPQAAARARPARTGAA